MTRIDGAGFPRKGRPDRRGLAASGATGARKQPGREALQEERLLVKRMMRGEEDAFERFFHAFFPPLYRFAVGILRGDEEVAHEVVQRTLCTAIDQVGAWRGEARLLTWLCAICRREIAGHFRRSGRAPVEVELCEQVPAVRSALESLLGADADPECRAMRSELATIVHVALERLPPHYGQALEWKYLEEASVKEIAQRLGSTPKAVESLLTRARGRYREALVALLPRLELEAAGGRTP